jgi:hypothetical protein
MNGDTDFELLNYLIIEINNNKAIDDPKDIYEYNYYETTDEDSDNDSEEDYEDSEESEES